MLPCFLVVESYSNSIARQEISVAHSRNLGETKKRVGASHNPHPRPRVLTPRSTSSTGEVNAARIMHQSAQTFNNVKWLKTRDSG